MNMAKAQSDYNEAQAAGHHVDCDGWRHHSRTTIRTDAGTFKPACTICGELEVIGSFSSESTALGFAAAHESFVPCRGECHSW